ncbi:MAG TPA: hypothetical protein DCE71_07280 [Parachlamydiales bacterium]|nr:hypothetical protein [Parachlamydiales bacterium]
MGADSVSQECAVVKDKKFLEESFQKRSRYRSLAKGIGEMRALVVGRCVPVDVHYRVIALMVALKAFKQSVHDSNIF